MERHDPAGVVLHQFLVALLADGYTTEANRCRHSEKSLEHHTPGPSTGRGFVEESSRVVATGELPDRGFCEGVLSSNACRMVVATGEMPKRGFSTPWTADGNRGV